MRKSLEAYKIWGFCLGGSKQHWLVKENTCEMLIGVANTTRWDKKKKAARFILLCSIKVRKIIYDAGSQYKKKSSVVALFFCNSHLHKFFCFTMMAKLFLKYVYTLLLVVWFVFFCWKKNYWHVRLYFFFFFFLLFGLMRFSLYGWLMNVDSWW